MSRGVVSDFSPAALAAVRAERGWTKHELALRSQVSRAALIDWESGRRMPSLTLLARVATALRVRVADLRARRGPATLIELRIAAGMRRSDAARAADINPATLARLEYGTGSLSVAYAAALARAYGVAVAEVRDRFAGSQQVNVSG